MASQYDPRQEFDYDPEDFLPPPPGLNPDGSFGPPQTLNEHKQERNAVPIPRNPDGSTTSPQEYGPEPPISYSTNMPETARQWGQAGHKYTFLAESPAAMKIARDLGAPDIYKGYRDEAQPSPFGPSAVGPEPKAGELDRMQAQKGGWKAHYDEFYGGVDPLGINPEEEAQKARKAQERKEAVDFIKGDPTKSDYKAAEKRVKEAGDNAGKAAEWKLKSAQEDHKGFQHYFNQQFTELQTKQKEQFTAEQAAKRQREQENKAQKDTQTRASVEAAQKYTEQALYGPNSWENYTLNADDLAKMGKDKNYTPKNRQIKERVLTDVNRVRELAGLPLLTEKQIQVPMKEYLDWGLFRTGETMTSEPGYRYEEGAAPARRSANVPRGNGGAAAPASQVVRTGTHNGRRVVQFADGRTEYAR